MFEDMFTYRIRKCVDTTMYINRYDPSVTNDGRHHSMDPPPRAACVFVLAVRARLLAAACAGASTARPSPSSAPGTYSPARNHNKCTSLTLKLTHPRSQVSRGGGDDPVG